MSTALNLQIPLPVGSLEAYLKAVHLVPMLTAEEERDFGERLRNENDLEAARQLVLSHLRFVVRVARGYSGYGLHLGDLIQEGNIGLMKAVKRFDPSIGVRLVSFAVHWIRAEIHEFILRNWRIVRVATTKAQRKLFFNLRSAKKRLGWMNTEEVEAIAKDLGVEPSDVQLMEERMNARDPAFDTGANDSEDCVSPAGYLEDMRFEPAQLVESVEHKTNSAAHLSRALTTLDERSRDIITKRWLMEDKKTLQALADEYHVSAERIRQLEKDALKTLRSTLAGVPLLMASGI